jgi:LEA14-like dessication related protein
MTRSARIAVVTSLFALAGCAGLGGVLRQGITPPEVSVLSAAPTTVDFEGLTVAVDLRVQNPNPIGLRARGFAWQVDVEGGRVASGDAPGGLNLPANGAATSRVTARLRFADLANLVRLAEVKERIDLRVAGSVAVETPIGAIDVPWSWTGDLPVPRLPRVELAGVRLGRQSFTETEVLVRLRVQNPNAFALPAASVKLDVDLAGDRVAQAASQPLAAMGAGATATLEVPVRLSLLGAGRAVLGARGRPLAVSVRGTAGFGWMQLPFAVSGDLPMP